MPALADGNERGQRVAHHWQAQRGKPVARQRGQLERQLDDILPAPFAGQRAVGEDRHGKCTILAVAGDYGGREIIRRHAAGGLCEPLFGSGDNLGVFL